MSAAEVDQVANELGGGANPKEVGNVARSRGDSSIAVRIMRPPGAVPDVSTLKLRFRLRVAAPVESAGAECTGKRGDRTLRGVETCDQVDGVAGKLPSMNDSVGGGVRAREDEIGRAHV